MAEKKCPKCDYPMPPEGKLREWNSSATEYCPCTDGTQCLIRQLSALQLAANEAGEVIPVLAALSGLATENGLGTVEPGWNAPGVDTSGRIDLDRLVARLRAGGGGEVSMSEQRRAYQTPSSNASSKT